MSTTIEIDFSNHFGRLRPDDLLRFEQANHFTLPDDYKKFLIDHNGGRPKHNTLPNVETDVNWLYSMCDEPDWASFFFALDVYQHRIPSWYIPIGYDSGGNVFILSLYNENKGTVALWYHEREHPDDGNDYYENVTKVADNFDQFMNSLI